MNLGCTILAQRQETPAVRRFSSYHVAQIRCAFVTFTSLLVACIANLRLAYSVLGAAKKAGDAPAIRVTHISGSAFGLVEMGYNWENGNRFWRHLKVHASSGSVCTSGFLFTNCAGIFTFSLRHISLSHWIQESDASTSPMDGKAATVCDGLLTRDLKQAFQSYMQTDHYPRTGFPNLSAWTPKIASMGYSTNIFL